MTDFSSRGPGGLYLKPDVTAPGIQILAGNTPASTDVATGPAGELYQAIAGTSMSAPVDAGAALLLKSLHPALVAGPDQVGADDDRHHQGRARRTARRPPTRSTSAPGAST